MQDVGSEKCDSIPSHVVCIKTLEFLVALVADQVLISASFVNFVAVLLTSLHTA